MTRNTPTRKDLKSPPRATGGTSEGKRTTFLLAGITALVLLAIAAFAVLTAGGGGDTGSFTPNARGLLPVGSQAPGFTADTVDGGSVSLEDAGDDEATMLVFFASWCPHCNKDAPIINDVEDQHEELRVIMVGIDDRDDPGKVRDFVDRYGIEGPAIYDPSLGSTYQVSGFPTTYVLDESNEIVAAHSGEAPREVYEGWISEALGTSG